MACKLRFNQPNQGLNFIYNVSAHVGDARTCPNLSDDVQLVQFFIKELIPKFDPGGGRKIKELPRVNGQFDAVTGFWIYNVQSSNEDVVQVDGIVSPAKGVMYGVKAWTIAGLNYKYKQFFPEKFDKLHLNPELSPALRAAIAA
ncbi:MAG: hypothetical protein JNK48_31130 [Bryobacterales bacterium]|nr:hypothetical protein [Bryobacterales bacterium]